MKTLAIFLAVLSCSFFPVPECSKFTSPPPASDFYAEPSLADSYKAKVVQEVFQKLKAAKGDFRSRKPELHLVETTGMGIAAAFPLSGVIKLEEKGYDLCTEFGADSLNALAILLGHELVHCYEKHSWENQFAWEYSHTSLKRAISNEHKKDEIQADYLGGVLAYQAGFKVFGIMDKFLDKVYESYQLTDENTPNYPGLEQRKLLAIESADKFKYFTNLFEMANLLTVQELYDDALTYYDQVMQDFQSREVYNNIGVVSMLAAIQHFSPKQIKFNYPVELDFVSRMKVSRGAESYAEYQERKLLDALFYFDNAIHLDPKYPIAHLNRACANTLLGIVRSGERRLEWKDASLSTERAIFMSENSDEWQSTLSDGYVMLGILSAMESDTVNAQRHFDKALEIVDNNVLAMANKSILGLGENPFDGQRALINSNETIDNIPFSAMDFGDSNIEFTLRKSPTDSITLWRKDFSNSYVMVHESIDRNAFSYKPTYAIFHSTEEGYTGATSKGISLNNGTYELITEKYGFPHEQFDLGNGSLLLYKYKNQDLIFHLASDGRLLRWSIYQEMGN